MTTVNPPREDTLRGGFMFCEDVHANSQGEAMLPEVPDLRSARMCMQIRRERSKWDEKLLKYGELFEKKMMDLSVNISLEEALDLGWKILTDCFDRSETGIKTELLDEFWK